MTWLRQLTLLLLLALAGPAFAQEPLPVPALAERVIDQTGTLTAEQRQRLIDKLAAFEREAGPQIVVLMVATTQPEDIASYAQRVGETWKIGRREVGDGLLIVVAKNDRRLWIAPAKALEGAVPDLAARRIISEQISPRFRADDYAGGLEAGIDALIARIKGENLPAPSERAPRGGGLPLTELLIFAFVALPIVASVVRRLFGRTLGTLASGGATGAIAWLVTGSLLIGIVGGIIGLLFGLFAGVSNFVRTPTRHHGGWIGGGGWAGGGSSGGWGGGGGGFSSGGGGDFGGGGAGGDW